MKVVVRLHSVFRLKTPEGVINLVEMDLELGATVAEVVEKLDLGAHQRRMLVVVNGRVVDLDQSLEDGDEVRLMPAISGGLRGQWWIAPEAEPGWSSEA